MNALTLYVITVLVWGTTWLAIKFQLGLVPATLSVAYRFLLASGILFVYCLVRKTKMCFSAQQHFSFLLLSLTAFSLNYFGTYYSEVYLPSGVVAILFATVPLWNILNSQIFLKVRPQASVVLGAMIGILGVIILFYHDIFSLNTSSATLKGLVLGMLGAFIASFGNILSAVNTRKGVEILPANAFAMFYGGVISLLIGLIGNHGLSFDFSWPYVASLVYLSVFGSIVAFGAYFSLIRLLGPAKASYNTVVIPVVALALSTIFENFVWTASSLLGVIVILGGNIFIMRKKKPKHLI